MCVAIFGPCFRHGLVPESGTAGTRNADSNISDLALVAAVASVLRPQLTVVFEPNSAPWCDHLTREATSWQGRVRHLAVPLSPGPRFNGVGGFAEDEFNPVRHELADLAVLAADGGCDDDEVWRWLDGWVKAWLAEGGVALVPGICDGNGNRHVARVVRDWLREQPRRWTWQEMPGEGGLGLLWRVAPEDCPMDFGPQIAAEASGEGEKSGRAVGAPAADLPLLPGKTPGGRCHASVIIAVHNEGARLTRTLAACAEACVRGEFEVLVIDDASTDGSTRGLGDHFPWVRVLHHAERRGVAAAKDLGARAARGAVLVFLDGHCKPEGDALAGLVAAVEENAGRAVVTPRVPALDPEIWRCQPGEAGHGFRLDLETLHQEWVGLETMRRVGRFRQSPALVGCCLAVSRDLYDELWGFDPGMRKWGMEDVDFGLKAWLLGYPVLHDPTVVIGHVFQATFDHFSVPADECLMNHLRLARKHLGDATWADWLERFRRRQPPALFQNVWALFQTGRRGLERERDYLQARRVRDEYWYARRFGLSWPQDAARSTRWHWADARARWDDHQRRPCNRAALPDAHLRGTAAMPGGGTLCLHVQLARTAGLVSVERLHFQNTGPGGEQAVPYASWLAERLEGRPLAGARQLTLADLLGAFDDEPDAGEGNNPLPGAARPGDLPWDRPDAHAAAATVLTVLRSALDQV